MARPRKVLDTELLTQLAALDCTLAEIAATLKCDQKTLTTRFAEEIRIGREKGKTSLRREVWRRAFAGSDKLLELLAMNRLGYSRKNEGPAAQFTAVISTEVAELAKLLACLKTS